jgi:putative DNA primase/helicase
MTSTTTSTHQHAVLTTALAVLAGGVSLVPVSAVTKRPIEALLPFDPAEGHGSWRDYQHRLPDEAEVRYWISKDAQIAIVGGAVSGGLLILDFDVPEKFTAWQKLAAGHYEHLPQQRTGGGGYQVAFRCPTPGKNDKLAYVPDASKFDGRRIAIETRGEGGYAIIAPSLHPSGNHYQMLAGNFAHIPLLSQTLADELLGYARQLDEAPYTTQQIQAMHQAMQQPSPTRARANGSASVIDEFNRATPIEDVLYEVGYQHCYRDRWSPPGSPRGRDSVAIKDNKAFHHDTDYPLADGYWHDAFDIWCYYKHGGDVKAAIKDAATILCLSPAPAPSSVPPSQPAPGPSSPPPPPPISPMPTPQQAFHPQLLDTPQTDAGNAECLVALYGERLRWCRQLDTWMSWSDNRWRADADAAALMAALRTVRERRVAAAYLPDPKASAALASWTYRSEMASKLKAMLSIAGYMDPFLSSIEDYDQQPMLAGVANGVLDLAAQTCRPGDQADMMSLQLGVAYDPQATCPRWEQFLEEVFGGNAELIAYIQRAVGYSLTGDVREQKLFLCFGDGNNGKSVLLDVLSSLLGEYAATAAFSTFDADRRSEQTNDLANLKGKRLVVISETNAGKRLDEGRVKAMTGLRDKITCRFLYKEEFSYTPECKIWMAMNHPPVVRNIDRGIWRRLDIIRFEQDFTGREDRTLPTKLQAELPGILNWALRGLHAWQQRGLDPPPCVQLATAEYKQSSDVVGQFLDEYTVNDPAGWITAQDLYNDFEHWSRNRGDHKPMQYPSFGKVITSKGYTSRRATISSVKHTIYEGLRRRTDLDP